MSDNPFVDDIADVELPMLQDEPQKPKNSVSSNQTSNSSKEDLQKRLEELKERERKLNQRRQEVLQQRPENGPKLNWPSFFPILRYDPDSDIPSAARKCVKTSLIGLVLYFFEAIWNVISVFSVSGLPKYSFATNIVFAIIFGIVGFFCILTFGYKKLYLSCAKHDIPISYTICQFLIIAYAVYLLVGLPDSGSVGIAVLLDMIAKHNNSNVWSIMCGFINFGLLLAFAICQFLTLVQSQKYQKVSGHDSPSLNTDSPEAPLNI